jgi:hypothetical protein
MSLHAWAVYTTDVDGNLVPTAGLVAGMSFIDYRDHATGAARTPPAAIVDLGGGQYGFEASDLDGSVGTAWLVDNGVDTLPRRTAGAVHAGGDPFSVWHLEDNDGELWTGAAPTITEYSNGTIPVTSPGVVAITTYLFSVSPSTADLVTGVTFLATSPAGAAPEFFQDTVTPAVPVPVVASSTYPADAVALELAGTIALPNPPGGTAVVLTYGAGGNLLTGPVRPIEALVGQLAVFVLQTGGQAPAAYMGQSESWHVTRVQVTVRSALNEFARGEALARALHARMHLNTPAGYTYCLAGESDPLYLGTDDDGAHRFVFNLDVGHRR